MRGVHLHLQYVPFNGKNNSGTKRRIISLSATNPGTKMGDPVETLSTGSAFYVTPKGRMVLGEGVIYRASDSTLHWFDCLSSPAELYILPVDPETGSATGPARILPLPDSVTIAAFRQNKPRSYIAAYYQGVCFLDEETGKLEVACEIIPSAERSQRRFNDGGVDAAGRFWLAENDLAATAFPPGKLPADYGVPRGRLWRYDPDGALHMMMPGGIICGNGVKWSPDDRTSKWPACHALFGRIVA
jgi:sugar lactone lactonase YvrE